MAVLLPTAYHRTIQNDSISPIQLVIGLGFGWGVKKTQAKGKFMQRYWNDVINASL